MRILIVSAHWMLRAAEKRRLSTRFGGPGSWQIAMPSAAIEPWGHWNVRTTARKTGSNEDAGINNRAGAILRELKPGLEALYGRRLKGIYLYGSYARGEEDEESDVDILVVLGEVDRCLAEIERSSHLISEISLKHSVSAEIRAQEATELIKHAEIFLAESRRYLESA